MGGEEDVTGFRASPTTDPEVPTEDALEQAQEVFGAEDDESFGR
jgi:hypothetical protein